MDALQTPFGSFTLGRYPRRRQEPLQAWNQADELLLQMASETGIDAEHILVVNDEHGALSIPLARSTAWTDSILSELAIVANARANDLVRPPKVLMLKEVPEGDFRLVLLRMPKHLPLLRWQLQVLRSALPEGTPLIAAGMQKHLGPGREKVFESFYGPTRRHEGWRKARAFSASLDTDLDPEFHLLNRWYCEELDFEMHSWPGVFSSGQLDQGARFMIESLPQLSPSRFAVDLACGTGVLGLYLARNVDCRSLAFVDESASAVASARFNYRKLDTSKKIPCHFIQADGFTDWQETGPDLILCNPPFHMDHTVDDFAGRRLIEQAARVIDIDGELWLVANRHLLYGRTLRRYFSEVEQYAQNSKFILWLARK